jgi:uncharacterized membrane protein
MLAVLYLVYVEIVRLYTICAWCTAFHVILLVLFLTTFIKLQQVMTTEREEPAT